jgi:hypothetical protein
VNRNIIYDGDRWERVTDERAKKLVTDGAITHCTGSCVAQCRAGSSAGDTMFHVITTWKHIEEIR